MIKNIFIESNIECNSRCKYCHRWMLSNPANQITADEWRNFIKELSTWAPQQTNVIISGGETLLEKEKLFAICTEAKKHGFFTTAITNGTLFNENTFADLIKYGPDLINFSIDSVNPELHDKIRGVPGLHKKIFLNVENFFNFQKEQNRKILIGAICVLSKSTLGGAPNLVRELKILGLTSLHFNPISTTIDNTGKGDPYFENEIRIPESDLSQILSALTEMKNGEYASFINNDIEDFKLMVEYFSEPPALFKKPACNASHSAMISSSGEITYCNEFKQHIHAKSLGNIRTDSFKDIWNSTLSNELRTKMRHCKQSCGLHGCHRL